LKERRRLLLNLLYDRLRRGIDLNREGNRDTATRLWSANLGTVDRAQSGGSSDPEILLAESLTLLALERPEDATAARQRALNRMSKSDSDDIAKNLYMGNWIALRLCALFGPDGHGIVASASQLSDGWVATLHQAACKELGALGIKHIKSPECGRQIASHCLVLASTLRHTKRLTDAHLVTVEVMEFAKALAQSLPDDPDSPMLMADAFQQAAKDAMSRKETSEAIGWLAKARESTERAVRLDPRRLETRRRLDELDRRLVAAKREAR
jgi:hypothetical protein